MCGAGWPGGDTGLDTVGVRPPAAAAIMSYVDLPAPGSARQRGRGAGSTAVMGQLASDYLCPGTRSAPPHPERPHPRWCEVPVSVSTLQSPESEAE